MRVWIPVLALGFAYVVGTGMGCAAGGNKGSDTSAGGSGAEGPTSTGNPTSTGTLATTGTGGSGGSECAKFTAEAQQAPAAMLFVVDMSASMTTQVNGQSKWATAQLAVVNAIDADAFDSMSLGLVSFPSSFTDPPACLCDFATQGLCAHGDIACCKQLGLTGVSCGTSVLPQVAIAPAGMMKSNAGSGVRHDIYQYLANHNPLTNDDDGAPIYDAVVSGYNALKNVNIAKRILVLITDGGFSCTSVSNRQGYMDLNMCPDWEHPDAVNMLIANAYSDAMAPIDTFIVGVPGSDSTGQKQGSYDTAPYHMRLALSTYAVSGSPTTIDPNCDKGLMFTQNGQDPAKPCHFDLSAGGMFDKNALATAIASIRGKALGCTYDLPQPPMGQSIDPTLVNVDVTLGGVKTTIPKRSDPMDQCVADGCWDYNAQQQVQLIGKTCSDVSTSVDAKVEIRVGCTTVIK